MTKIMDVLIPMMMISAITVAVVFVLTSCKTQASMEKGENPICFQDRYRVREGFPSETIALECANAYKWKRCMDAIKEDRMLDKDKREFRDFNDCWSKGK